MAKKRQRRTWMGMTNEEGARERIGRERPDALKVLDYLQTCFEPFEESGWTAFNDWLDKCYFNKKKVMQNRPDDIHYVELDEIRCIVFPAAR